MSVRSRLVIGVSWLCLMAVLALYATAVVVHHRNIEHLRPQPAQPMTEATR